MGQSSWTPSWYKQEKHGVGWERVKEAMRRDWEQTKHDFGGRQPDLDQDVQDTVKQAAGKQEIPPGNQPNMPDHLPQPSASVGWADAEEPLFYGYAARREFGASHPQWDDGLERSLKGEWEKAKDTSRKGWGEVKNLVRRGFEHKSSN